mmetsp:Transcript_106786/g.297237  ORF Transcript_106786/g.297237 Transcript_106786/m.297237 type:complete len:201 (-) Transcript_106786:592-1194(-)
MLASRWHCAASCFTCSSATWRCSCSLEARNSAFSASKSSTRSAIVRRWLTHALCRARAACKQPLPLVLAVLPPVLLALEPEPESFRWPPVRATGDRDALEASAALRRVRGLWGLAPLKRPVKLLPASGAHPLSCTSAACSCWSTSAASSPGCMPALGHWPMLRSCLGRCPCWDTALPAGREVPTAALLSRFPVEAGRARR